uniref:Uncharacterized protein n=1 Tax=Sander lucioperca TaxID=283035 RepID=A0A8C9YXY0_SANLU
MLRLVRHVAPKIPPNNAMPCSNILLNVVLFHSLHGTVHCILLHFIRHVCILYHCLLVRHFGFLTAQEKEKKYLETFST